MRQGQSLSWIAEGYRDPIHELVEDLRAGYGMARPNVLANTGQGFLFGSAGGGGGVLKESIADDADVLAYRAVRPDLGHRGPCLQPRAVKITGMLTQAHPSGVA